MPPGSLSTFAVMKPGPNTARKAISWYFRTPNPATRRSRLRSRLNIFSFIVHKYFLRLLERSLRNVRRAGWLLLEDQQNAQYDHYARRAPCHPVKESGIYVFAHEAGLVDQQKHEYQHKRQQDTVENLREHRHLKQREPGQQDHRRARAHQPGIQPVEKRGFAELFVQSGFKAQAFAHRVSRGERQNGCGKQRGIEQSSAKEDTRPMTGQRAKGLSCISSVIDDGVAKTVQGGGARDNDESRDQDGKDGAHKNVNPGGLII